ncbi:MAG: hypothetical protein K8R63_06195 [Bacteroidales bacterium]|nr:hypothetical protein [Bacteroidales bacterium]
MKKFTTVFLLLFIFISSAFSQLSTRENEATNLKLGTRPVKGDFALTFGYDFIQDNTANLYGGNLLQGGDLLTFKAYIADGTALRIGVRLYKETYTHSGDVAPETTPIIPLDPRDEISVKRSAREYTIVPGIEKHFLKSNIFDVYTGADLYLGFGRKLYNSEISYTDGDYDNYQMTMSTTVMGLGGVVGFNVFIAQLPISLGLEYGLNLKWEFGNKTKISEDQRVGGTAASAEYDIAWTDWASDVQNYQPAPTPGTYYNKLKSNYFGMDTNQNVRIILNIYFGK